MSPTRPQFELVRLRKLFRRLSADSARLMLIITALSFGGMLAIGLAQRTAPIAPQFDSPAKWSIIQSLGSPTATPVSRDQRVCASPDTLYASQDGQWYDLCRAADRLYVSVLAADLSLRHGPTDLNERYPACAADVLTDGDLVLFCRDNSQLSAGPQSLRLHLVDSQGRPRPPISVPGQADYQALAVDPSGVLDLAWLDPEPGAIWALHQVAYPGDSNALETLATPPTDDVTGVLNLTVPQRLTGFALSADAHFVYAIWGDAAGGTRALIAPTADRRTAQQITVAATDQFLGTVRRVSDQTVAVALVDPARGGMPAVAFLSNGHLSRIDAFPGPSVGDFSLFQGPYLALRPDGRLQVQWSVWTATQRQMIYAATTNVFP